MATDTVTPLAKPPLPTGDPDRPTGKVLPALLLAALVAGIAYGVYELVKFVTYFPVGEGQAVQFVFRRLEESVGLNVNARMFWIPTLVVLLSLGIGYAIWMYVRDSRAVGWLWATFLGTLRCTVYVLLAGMFLLPALQTFEKSEQFSRVLVLFDLSGSMGVSDQYDNEGTAGPTRLQQVTQLLTENDSAFLTELQKKNPVFAYRFGAALDPEAKEFAKGASPSWSSADWAAWMRLDLKQWVLAGLSDKGRDTVAANEGFKDESIKATDQWAAGWFKNNLRELQDKLDESDRQKLDEKAKNLPQKLESRQQIINGTNYGDALLATLMREGNNMLAGVVIIGDGHSTTFSQSTLDEARSRSKNGKIPVFAVGIGETREKKEIRIVDLRAPTRTPPDDPIIVRVTAQGEGLADQPFEAFLDIYKPGQTPGKDKPILSVPSKGEFKGSPLPVSQVEFTLDPADEKLLPIRAKEDKKEKPGYEKEFERGEYKLVVRVPKAKGEIFKDKEHVSDLPVAMNVEKRPLRVLIFSGGAAKDSQFVRRLFLNERDKKRAELCIYQQVSEMAGSRSLDVPDAQLLKKFPDVLRVEKNPTDKPDDQWYNLATYDVILAFDPDWTKVPQADIDRMKDWVEKQGGGLVYVAGSINTPKITEPQNATPLASLLQMLPVVPADERAGQYLDRPTDKPIALKFPTAGGGDADFMKLDDAGKSPIAGWHEFFYGKAKEYVDPAKDPVKSGIYRCYPILEVKQTATTLATCPTQTRRGEAILVEDQPYIVTMPYPEGRVVFLGGPMVRLREGKNGEQYYERFWTKLARYAAANALKRESKSRGMIVMGRRPPSGKPLDFEAKLLDKDLKEMPETNKPKWAIYRADELTKPILTDQMKGKAGAKGWFSGRVEAPALPGKYQLRVQVPDSVEELREEFYVIESNPELDDTRPDFVRLRNMTSPVSELRLADAAKVQKLRDSLKSVGADKDNEARLFFDLRSARLIPEFLTTDRKEYNNRGRIVDLWSDGATLGTYGGKPVVIATALLLVVGLLSVEWLTRKLLRLA